MSDTKEDSAAPEGGAAPDTTTVQVPAPDLTKLRFIVQIKTYLDECHRRVQEKRVVEGETPAGMCVFSGAAIMLFPNPQGGDDKLKRIKNFDIPGATTAQEAFGLFDTLWNQVLKNEGAESGIPEPAAAPFIVEVKQMLDNNLQRVQEHICVEGVLPPKYPRFHGSGITRLPDGQEFIEEFILDGAETLLDAYKVFSAVHAEVARRSGEQFRQFQENMMREAKRRQLAAQGKGKKKLIVPEDKRGKHGPLGGEKKKIIIPGEAE